MKIALLGNMNNANFALLRHLKSRGLNVDLLLWKNDGVLSHSHFKPENDTYDFKYWSKFIKRTSINNALSSIFFNPLKPKNYITEKYFLNLYKKYDLFIASGIAPALFEKFNKKLDIFYPLSIGVEFVNTNDDKEYLNTRVKRYFFDRLKKIQKKGIQNSRLIINPEIGKTEKVLKQIKVETLKLILPLIYKEKKIINSRSLITKKINKFDFKIISHTRHLWKFNKLFSRGKNKENLKNNHWLLIAFKNFIKETKSNSCLILSKSGPDYVDSFKLAKKLEISDRIIWLPIMPRKKIIQIIKQCDLGVGEFYQFKKTFFGGTTLEFLSQGKATIQSFDLSNKNFEKIFKLKAPPLFKVNNKIDLKKMIKKLYKDTQLRKNVEQNTNKWFLEEYCKKTISNWVQSILLIYKDKKKKS